MDTSSPGESRSCSRRRGRARGAGNLRPKELEVFLDRVRLGDSVEKACELIGRAKSTLYARAKRDRAFASRWKDAQGCRELREAEFLRGLREGLTISAAARLALLSEYAVYLRMRSDRSFHDRVDVARGPLQAEAEGALIRQALGVPERMAEYDADGQETVPYRPAERGDPGQLRFLLRNRFPGEWHEARFRR